MELKKIFVTKQAGIGDALLVTPILASLKKRFPSSTITFMTTPSAAPAVQGLPFIDKVLVYDKKKDRIWKVISSIWCYDAAFFFDLQYRAAILAFFARIPIRVGLQHKRSRWLTHGIPWNTYMDSTYEPYVFADILKQTIGIQLPRVELDTLYFAQPTITEEESVAKLLSDQGIKSGQQYIVCSLTTAFHLKDWPVQSWKNFIKQFYEKYNIPTIILGSYDKEKGICESNGVVDLRGKTNIKQAASIIKGSTLLVNSCSLPLHIAAAFDVPCVALYGYSDSKRWAPRKNCIILSADLPCSPCDGYMGSSCQEAKCMQSITVAEVMKACDFIMDK